MDEQSRAAVALAGAARFARVSAWLLVVFAGLSTVLNLLAPFTVHFLISVCVLGNGICEWRLARQLGRGEARAPDRLALNQFALGVEVLLYTAWRLYAFSPAEILALLDRPEIRPLVDALPPEELREIVGKIPPLFYTVIAVAGVATAAGCWAVAWYYRTRRKYLPAAAIVPTR